MSVTARTPVQMPTDRITELEAAAKLDSDRLAERNHTPASMVALGQAMGYESALRLVREYLGDSESWVKWGADGPRCRPTRNRPVAAQTITAAQVRTGQRVRIERADGVAIEGTVTEGGWHHFAVLGDKHRNYSIDDGTITLLSETES